MIRSQTEVISPEPFASVAATVNVALPPLPEFGAMELTVGRAVKVAATLCAAVIVRFWGVATPLSAPEKPANPYPLFAAAPMDTTWGTGRPLYQPLAGLMEPPSAGLAAVVR